MSDFDDVEQAAGTYVVQLRGGGSLQIPFKDQDTMNTVGATLKAAMQAPGVPKPIFFYNGGCGVRPEEIVGYWYHIRHKQPWEA